MQKQNYVSRGRAVRRPQSVDGILPRPTKYIRQSAAQAARAHNRPVAARRVGVTSNKPVTKRATQKRKKTGLRLSLLWKPLLAAPVLAVILLVCAHFRTPAAQQAAKTQAVSLLSSQKASAETPQPIAQPTPTPVIPYSADMNAAIGVQASLTASASLIDLQTGTEYDAGNYNSQFTAASTTKLVAVFDYIHQVELGKASLTQSIAGDTAQNLIQRMIVNSDNDAWAKLNSYLHFAQEQNYLSSLGVTATIQPNNLQFSTPNMAKLLQLLYQGKLMNETHQMLIYSFMSHTTVTNLIQAVLPAGATVYHKYGQVDGVLHDASIIEYQGHAYVLVIYTNNSDGTNSQAAAQVNLIHAITTAAFKNIQTAIGS